MSKPERRWWDMSKDNPEKEARASAAQLRRRAAYRKTIEERRAQKMEVFEMENRPHFIPLPEDWMNHKHMNVPDAKGNFPIEERLKKMLNVMDRMGYLEIEKPEKKERTTYQTNQGVVFGPKSKLVKEEAEVDLDDALDEAE